MDARSQEDDETRAMLASALDRAARVRKELAALRVRRVGERAAPGRLRLRPDPTTSSRHSLMR